MYLQVIAHDDRGLPPHARRSNLRVTVTVTLDVDRDAWELAYGTRDANVIRQDVKAAYLDGSALFAADAGVKVTDAR